VIRRHLVILFILQIGFVLLLSGLYLDFKVKKILEEELGHKLETVAAAIGGQIDVSLVTLLAPGDEGSRTYQNITRKLVELKEQTNMQRISIFSSKGDLWVDSETSPIGGSYPRYMMDRVEIDYALKDHLKSSVLFAGNDKKLFKTGYAPLKVEGKIVGVIAVEGSAQSLKSIVDIQRNILNLGIFSLLISFVLALFTSRRIVSPITKLQIAAREIGKGNLEKKIAVTGRDEISFLEETMEEMRKGIIRRDAQQRSMLASVAHEIRNPLGGIELFAGLLHEDLPDEKLKEKTAKILKESKNLKSLIQHFLDYARPALPKPESCDTVQCWNEVRELLDPHISGQNITVQVQGNALVYADPQHLKQIFINLALNSIQAMSDESEKRISLEISKNKNFAKILFSDNGAGVAEKNIDQIFEPFFSQKANGLGLGLSIVKNLTENNKGRIRLLQTGNKGACFELVFPLSP
jgi:signal transduction histidine kinase